MLIVCNVTPVLRPNDRVGIPTGGFRKEALDSNASEYRGDLNAALPPLAAVFFKREERRT
ncbi:MAG: hypothetical protein HYY65_06925 [Candidatus Tectomicrobia bacterium]|uniref:Alpha-amylase/branching enzyme C-terminal all beta domain-containing protein n=1 Tax=Tectimicrobiota bacterium TaxID=2528274 RepID=A0A932GPV1_UNCTE|nr:hypothetical protein [Candidatus Tectomicrobia bacterium]